MLRSLILCVVLVIIDCKILQSQGSTSKASFELFSGDDHGSMTSMFHKKFHQCSLEVGCNFVARDAATNVYNKYASEAQLPVIKKDLVIFKKRKLGPHKDCKEIMDYGETTSGIYEISIHADKTLKVYCDMATDGGGWTVFQRRVDASTNFYRGWSEYQKGFGNLKANFWLGLDAIHALTSANEVSLRVELGNLKKEREYAKYSKFKVGTEKTKYKLDVSGFSGNVRDALAFNNRMRFATMDNKDNNCPMISKGAWWYYLCGATNLNGVHPQQEGVLLNQQMKWYSYAEHAAITFSEMKLRRN